MKQFLIIQTAFLGDVILCTPLISELNRIYPNAKIDIVVRKGNEYLLKNNPKINQVYIWEKKKVKYKSLISVIKLVRKNKYTEVINLQRFTSSGLICLFSKSNFKIGFDKNAMGFMYGKRIKHDMNNGEHEVSRNLKTIAHHGAKSLIRPELFPSEEDYANVEKFKNKKYFCLAPASVWETKKLPFNKWVELIKLLNKKGQVYLIGGSDDIKLCNSLLEKLDKTPVILAGKLSLLESAALMKDAKMNYVNDSGPLHLASAMNAPTRAFFCSTVERFGFGPLAEDSKVLDVNYDLYCRPCGIHGFKVCPEGHFKCGNDIELNID